MDPHDVDCYVRSLEAGARGDLEASLASELAGRVVLESPHRIMVQDLIDQGETAPAWAFSRWCVDLAARSMLFWEDPRIDTAVNCVLAYLYPGTLAQMAGDEVDRTVLGTRIAAGDHLAAELALYEFGGLADYLANHAEPGLLDRTDRMEEWVGAEIHAFQFVDLHGPRIVLRDLVGGGEVDVLNIGAMTRVAGEGLIGRLVPITAAPGLMFATRPISVDLGTAQMVARRVSSVEPLAWLDALSDVVRSGRQQEGFHCTAPTLFTSDLPLPPVAVDPVEPVGIEEEAWRIRDLREKGYTAEVANALGVLEIGIISATVDDRACAGISPDIVDALTTPGAFEAALVECTAADTAAAWRVIAAVVPEHVVERCLTLAHRAEAAVEAKGSL